MLTTLGSSYASYSRRLSAQPALPFLRFVVSPTNDQAEPRSLTQRLVELDKARNRRSPRSHGMERQGAQLHLQRYSLVRGSCRQPQTS